ncbi:hypothetical protein [Parapedobacter defluvii]|uniref:hypothetical protein n=1 Tax=Parapedobacter defluvii TaxID=2045106 RepID=UPI0033426A8B
MHHLIRIAAVMAGFFGLPHGMVIAQPYSGDLARLPDYSDHSPVNEDWLISPISQAANVYRIGDNQLALSNGLITRTFSTTPGGATIGLDNLVTGESLLRSISPEAILWVNGHEIKVGGLIGQPVQNYLDPAWIPQMEADPLSLKLVSWDRQPVEERFSWTPRTEWLPKPTEETKGTVLRFSYKADEATIHQRAMQLTSDDQRQKLFDDQFITLSSKWQLVSANNDRSVSFINEGKPGQMMGPENYPVFAEQPLPADTRVVIARINTGTDRSTEYGPGVTLVYPDKTPLKLFLSPGSRSYGLLLNGTIQYFRGMDPATSHFLRLQLEDDEVHCAISTDGKEYQTLATVKILSKPTTIRVGKTDPMGGATAAPKAGNIGRSHVQSVALLGDPLSPSTDMDFLSDLTVHVYYEMYTGIPLLSKWVTVEYDGADEVVVNNIRTEHLAVTEAESAVEHKQRWELPPIFAQSDFAFGSMSPNASENASVEWRQDSTYTTQVNYALQTPTVLVCEPKHGVGQEISHGKPFESMRLWELLYDGSDRERRGLAQRRMYRTIAPWTQENPVIMHVRSADDASVKKAIDQSAEVGFEMVIMTFGSGFNLEDTTKANIQRMKALRDYAHNKGVALGGYSLLASRSIDADNDVVMPPGMTPAFGRSPCLLSEWGDQYFQTLYDFYEKTGMDILEHDGSYPGDVCASCDHPGHRGLEDSQWKQFVRIRDFYRWCRSRGIYLNIPDWYFLQGSTKIAMGYRETNWSLPREYQEIIERQNIYDGTWEKTPSMGWMFVPLVEYHGGGPAATIEPLHDHLPHYEQRLANLFGAGVQACYRGPQLYDTPETKVLVKKWVDFYKRHRRILDSDIIHLRRPDGRDYDAILHVDPAGEEKGLLMVYNPLDTPIKRTLTVDLYYTGLRDKATVGTNEGGWETISMDGTSLQLPVNIPANGQVWYVLK